MKTCKTMNECVDYKLNQPTCKLCSSYKKLQSSHLLIVDISAWQSSKQFLVAHTFKRTSNVEEIHRTCVMCIQEVNVGKILIFSLTSFKLWIESKFCTLEISKTISVWIFCSISPYIEEMVFPKSDYEWKLEKLKKLHNKWKTHHSSEDVWVYEYWYNN